MPFFGDKFFGRTADKPATSGGIIGSIIPMVPRTTSTGIPILPANDPSAPKAVDPITGREIDASNLGPGASSAGASVARGFAMDTLAEQRRQTALGGLSALLNDPTLTNLTNTINQTLTNPSLDENYVRNLVSLGVDKAGINSLGLQRNIASSLGARGIGVNSPLAAGLGAQLEFQNLSQIRTAQRDVGNEALRLMAQQRALGIQGATNLLGYKAGVAKDIANVQLQVPQYGYDALQGLSELQLQKYEIDKAAKAGKKASSNSLIGSIIGGVGSAIGAIGSLI